MIRYFSGHWRFSSSQPHLSPVAVVELHALALTPESETKNMCVFQMFGDCCPEISGLQLGGLVLGLCAFEVWQVHASGLNQTTMLEHMYCAVREGGLQRRV